MCWASNHFHSTKVFPTWGERFTTRWAFHLDAGLPPVLTYALKILWQFGTLFISLCQLSKPDVICVQVNLLSLIKPSVYFEHSSVESTLDSCDLGNVSDGQTARCPIDYWLAQLWLFDVGVETWCPTLDCAIVSALWILLWKIRRYQCLRLRCLCEESFRSWHHVGQRQRGKTVRQWHRCFRFS